MYLWLVCTDELFLDSTDKKTARYGVGFTNKNILERMYLAYTKGKSGQPFLNKSVIKNDRAWLVFAYLYDGVQSRIRNWGDISSHSCSVQPSDILYAHAYLRLAKKCILIVLEQAWEHFRSRLLQLSLAKANLRISPDTYKVILQ